MIITRYLLKNLLLATVFVAAALTAIIWLNLLLDRLSLFINSDASAGMLVRLVLLSTPQFAEVMLPLALVAAVLFVYSRMAADNEIVVMRASGVSHSRLARPALVLGAVMAAALACFTTYLTPTCFYRMHVLRQELAREYSAFLLREGVFNSFGDGLTIYVRSRKPGGEVDGLLIYDTREDKSRPVTVIAKRGIVRMDGEAPAIILYDGVREQGEPATGAVSRLHFEQYAFEVVMPAEKTLRAPRTADEMTLAQLFQPPAGGARQTRGEHDAFLAEAHRRIVIPFNAIGFALVAAAVVLLGRPGRLGYHRNVTAAALVIGALEALDLSLVSATRTHLQLVPVLYAAVLLPIALAGLALHGSGEQLLATAKARWRRRAWRADAAAAVT